MRQEEEGRMDEEEEDEKRRKEKVLVDGGREKGERSEQVKMKGKKRWKQRDR